VKSHFFLLFVLALSIPGPGFADLRAQDLENPPGWAWLISPKPADLSSWSSNGVLAEHRKAHDGQFEITVAMQKESGSAYRAVAFDTDGNRHELTARGAGSGDLVLWTFSDASRGLPFERVEWVGIEVLSQDGWPAASQEAAIRAEEAGTRTLPLPQKNQKFEFELVGVDGILVESENYLGKVTIIDCWATWCSPCMAKMPYLKILKDRWGDQGLEILGINFDQDTGKAKRTVEELGLDWPQVGVPADPVGRKMWWEVSGISTLPRIFVLDREGMLVYDGSNIEEIKKMVSDLCSE
jgi:thiol-disulfide isomerase/thioredoxin